jgi:hypothetical protein
LDSKAVLASTLAYAIFRAFASALQGADVLSAQALSFFLAAERVLASLSSAILKAA